MEKVSYSMTRRFSRSCCYLNKLHCKLKSDSPELGLPLNNASIACESPTLPVAETKYTNAGFHDWNFSSGFIARVINAQNQLYSFTHAPSGVRSRLPLPHSLPHSTAIDNPPYVSILPLLPPPVPGHMIPSGYNGDPYFPEAYTPLHCAPVPPPVPQPLPAIAIAISSCRSAEGSTLSTISDAVYSFPHPEVAQCSEYSSK